MKNWEALKALQDGWSVRHVTWTEGSHIPPECVLSDMMCRALIILTDGWERFEQPEHDFKWAVDQLLDGKTVRRLTWSASNGLVLCGSLCAVWKGYVQGCMIRKEDLAAHDWVLFEEDKP